MSLGGFKIEEYFFYAYCHPEMRIRGPVDWNQAGPYGTAHTPCRRGFAHERQNKFQPLFQWILMSSAGSGYMTACLQELVGPTGTVVGVEVHKMLVDNARRALKRWHKGVIESGAIVLLQGNALRGAALLALLVQAFIHVCSA